MDCDYDAGGANGLEVCVNVNAGWYGWTGDLSGDSYPDSDNAKCRIKIDCG